MLNSFWIELPILYALTVGGLVSGYRRGGVPPDRRWLRALLAGLPVMVGLMFAWAIICGVVGPRPADVGPALSILNSLLTLLFVLSASALAGSVLARRDLFDIHKRGTVLLDETEQGPPVVDPEVLTLAGYPLTLLDAFQNPGDDRDRKIHAHSRAPDQGLEPR
jgi:hypothetical protein